MKNDETPESDSNVWASYSDLFTNVAIIFLVMFVFSLIKATMSQIKTVQDKRQHENELKSKLSKKDMQKSAERVAKVEAAVEEMKKYEQVIDEKVKELNDYAKKLQANKDVLKEVLEAQSKQDSMMKAAEEKLLAETEQKKQKEFALEEAKLRIKMLNEELERTQTEVSQREDLFQKKLVATQTDSKQKETELKNIEQKFKQSISELNQKLSKAESEASFLQQELKKEITRETEQSKLVGELRKQLQAVEGQIASLNGTSEKLNQEKSTLASSLNSLNKEHSSLKRDYQNLMGKYEQSDASAKGLERQLAELNSRAASAEGAAGKWKGEFDKKMGEAEGLKKQLADSQRRFGELANVMTKLKDTMKNDVAMKLQGKFKEQGLDANVNLKTGEVVLLSGEGFNFEKGSAKLSGEAKANLKKLIPVYANVLLGDDKIFSQITTINMEGHSSPSFGGKYVAPEDKDAEAYGFNMRLSAMRAASVANYLMSKEIGDYPHKDKMKVLLQSVGVGYMRPIQKELIIRGPASAADEDCGPWDCQKSQRVQINFLLKDNMQEIHKIIDANGGIK